MSQSELETRSATRLPSLEHAGAEPDSSAREPTSARDPIDRVVCRLGDASCSAAHAAALGRSCAINRAPTPGPLLRLQRQYGNRYVGRVLERSRDDPSNEAGLEAVEHSIEQARGGGHELDGKTRGQMETAFGTDFGAVRIHTDARANDLSRAISARAFATGRDVFFRQGEYDPGSSSGRELLAHELTHVVQQTGGLHRKMTVSEPNDPHEVEADQMARLVIEREHEHEDEQVRAKGVHRKSGGTAQRKAENLPLPNWGSSYFNKSNMTLNPFARLIVDGAVVRDDWAISGSAPAAFKVPKCAKTGEVQIVVGGYWFQNNSFGNLSGEGTSTVRAAFDVNDKGEIHFKPATVSTEAKGEIAQMTASGTAADNPPLGGSLVAQVAITSTDQKGAQATAPILGFTSTAPSGNSFARGYRADVTMEKKIGVPMSKSQSVFHQVGKHKVIGSKDPSQPANIREIYAFLGGLPKEVRKELEDGVGDRKAKIEVIAKASVTTPPDPGAGSNVALTEKRRDAVVRLLQDFLGGAAKIKARAIGELEATDPGEAGYERVATITVSWEDDPCEAGSSKVPGGK
jgi:hypothetical protein